MGKKSPTTPYELTKSAQDDMEQRDKRHALLAEAERELIGAYRLRSGNQRELSALQKDFLKEAMEGLGLFETIPTYMFGPVLRYVVEGRKPGHFLSAVITNDLREAIARADDKNQAALVDWVKFFYNYTPGYCWGSTSNLKSWISNGLELRGRR